MSLRSHRDELRYTPDPKEVRGEDFSSETFRVLKESAEGINGREPIAKFFYSLSISAAQLEINAHLGIPFRREDATNHSVPFSGNLKLIANLANSLSELVNSLSEK